MSQKEFYKSMRLAKYKLNSDPEPAGLWMAMGGGDSYKLEKLNWNLSHDIYMFRGKFENVVDSDLEGTPLTNPRKLNHRDIELTLDGVVVDRYSYSAYSHKITGIAEISYNTVKVTHEMYVLCAVNGQGLAVTPGVSIAMRQVSVVSSIVYMMTQRDAILSAMRNKVLEELVKHCHKAEFVNLYSETRGILEQTIDLEDLQSYIDTMTPLSDSNNEIQKAYKYYKSIPSIVMANKLYGDLKYAATALSDKLCRARDACAIIEFNIDTSGYSDWYKPKIYQYPGRIFYPTIHDNRICLLRAVSVSEDYINRCKDKSIDELQNIEIDEDDILEMNHRDDTVKILGYARLIIANSYNDRCQYSSTIIPDSRSERLKLVDEYNKIVSILSSDRGSHKQLDKLNDMIDTLNRIIECGIGSFHEFHRDVLKMKNLIESSIANITPSLIFVGESMSWERIDDIVEKDNEEKAEEPKVHIWENMDYYQLREYWYHKPAHLTMHPLNDPIIKENELITARLAQLLDEMYKTPEPEITDTLEPEHHLKELKYKYKLFKSPPSNHALDSYERVVILYRDIREIINISHDVCVELAEDEINKFHSEYPRRFIVKYYKNRLSIISRKIIIDDPWYSGSGLADAVNEVAMYISELKSISSTRVDSILFNSNSVDKALMQLESYKENLIWRLYNYWGVEYK